MSKSLGNFISRETIAEICQEYSVDVYRYFLLRAVAFGRDGDFSHDALRSTYNADLANGIGNLLSRTLKMIGKYFDGALPAAAEDVAEAAEVRAAAKELTASAAGHMEACEFHVYLEKLLALATATNVFIERTEPFQIAKDPSQRGRLGTILYTCAEAVRLILLHLRPVMPATCDRALAQLGWTPEAGEAFRDLADWGVLPAGMPVGKAEPLFPRKP